MTTRPHGDAGFTLLEMLVVVAILAVVATVVISRGPPRSARQEVAAASAILSSALRASRAQAIATDRAVRFTLDPSRLPSGVAVTAPAGGIVFTPDGGASGGWIGLASGTLQAAVSVDLLTGRVAVHHAR